MDYLALFIDTYRTSPTKVGPIMITILINMVKYKLTQIVIKVNDREVRNPAAKYENIG